MYSHEIEQMLNSKGHVLTKDEYFELNTQTCPQITRVLYNSENNHFYIFTNDGYRFEFEVRNN